MHFSLTLIHRCYCSVYTTHKLFKCSHYNMLIDLISHITSNEGGTDILEDINKNHHNSIDGINPVIPFVIIKLCLIYIII